MSAYLYRLFDVQTFNGQKLAIYNCVGNFPNAQILSDAQELADGTRKRAEVVQDSFYDTTSKYSYDGRENRRILTYYTRLLKRSQKVIDENKNVDKAIFVNSTHGKNWRGERTLYENKHFDAIKCDTPEFTGCIPAGTIMI